MYFPLVINNLIISLQRDTPWQCFVYDLSPPFPLLQVWREMQIYSSCWSVGSWSRFARAPGRRTASSNCRKTARRCGMSPTKHSSETRPVSVIFYWVSFTLCTKRGSSMKCNVLSVSYVTWASSSQVIVSGQASPFRSQHQLLASLQHTHKHTPQIPLVLQNM